MLDAASKLRYSNYINSKEHSMQAFAYTLSAVLFVAACWWMRGTFKLIWSLVK